MVKQRVLLKLSGESLCPKGESGIDASCAGELAAQIESGLKAGKAELAIIVGGGNLLRGAQLSKGGGVDRLSADTMGMLATVMNSLALASALRRSGVPTRIFSALPPCEGTEAYSSVNAIRCLSAGEVIILAGGTGNPYFTTDTTAALRAIQIGASVVLKGTKVAGVYSADPHAVSDAVLYEQLTYSDALDQELAVMDRTAFSLCQEHRLPIRVFDMYARGNIGRVLRGETIGTLVSDGRDG